MKTRRPLSGHSLRRAAAPRPATAMSLESLARPLDQGPAVPRVARRRGRLACLPRPAQPGAAVPGLLAGILVLLGAWPLMPVRACAAQEPVPRQPEPAGAEVVLTLDGILETALARNWGLEVSRQDVDASRSIYLQAKSGYMPQLTGSGSYDRKYYENAQQAQAMGSAEREFNTYSATLSASQHLYDFGKTIGKIRQGRHGWLASRSQLDQTVSEVIRDVRKAYFEVLKKKRLVDVSEESLASQERHLQQARAFHQAGTRPRIDVTKAELSWSQARLDLISARYALMLARVDLENLLAGPPVEGAYRLAEVEVAPAEEPALEPLVRASLARRPDLEVLRSRLQAADAGVQAARAGWFPSLNAAGSYQWENIEFPLSEGWTAGVVFDWDLFPGLRTVGEVREALANRSGLAASLKQTELQVVQEVSQAVLQVNEAVETIRTAEIALAQARENMNLAQGRYEKGVGDAIEFNDAQLSLTEAKSDLVQATYGYLQARAELDRAVGREVFSEVPAQGSPAPAAARPPQPPAGR